MMLVYGDGVTPHGRVRIDLRAIPTAYPSSYQRTYWTSANARGEWRMSLQPNSEVTPAGTYYVIRTDYGTANQEFKIVTVPRGTGSVHVDDLPGGQQTVVVNSIGDEWDTNSKNALTEVVKALGRLGELVVIEL